MRFGMLLVLASLAGCGGDDAPADGGGDDAGPIDATPTELARPVRARFEGTSFDMTHGVAVALGSTVLDVDAMAAHAIVLADQELRCSMDFGARPAPGRYAIAYVDAAVGTTSPVTVTMIEQTSGPRSSKTFDGSAADVLSVRDGLMDVTLDAMLDEGGVTTSLFGGFVVPQCT